MRRREATAVPEMRCSLEPGWRRVRRTLGRTPASESLAPTPAPTPGIHEGILCARVRMPRLRELVVGWGMVVCSPRATTTASAMRQGLLLLVVLLRRVVRGGLGRPKVLLGLLL